MSFVFLRHAEGPHNVALARDGAVALQSSEFFDCSLTEGGREQCSVTRARLAHFRFVAVVSSPLRRAVETADLIAETAAIRRTHDAIVEAQEEVHPCNWRAPRATMEASFPHWCMEWSEPLPPAPTGNETREAVQARVEEGMGHICRWLADTLEPLTPRDAVLIVSHWTPLRTYLGVHVDNAEYVVRPWDAVMAAHGVPLHDG